MYEISYTQSRRKEHCSLFCYWNKEQIPLYFFYLMFESSLQIKLTLMSQFPHLFNGNNNLFHCLDLLGLKGQVSLERKSLPFLLPWLRAPWGNQATEQRWWPLSWREWAARWQSAFSIMTLTLVVCNLWSSLLIKGAVGCRSTLPRHGKQLLPKRKKKSST